MKRYNLPIFIRDVRRSFKADILSIALSILSMAIALATTTVTLGIVDATILHPLPYPASEEIVEISLTHGSSGQKGAFTNRFFYDAQSSLPGFQSIGALSYSDMILQSDNEPIVVKGLACSASLFDVLNLKPLHGRLFDKADEIPNVGGSIALISEELWVNRYGGDPGILGKSIRINELPFTVVGVLKAGLRIPPLPSAPSVWAPLGSDPMIAQIKKMLPSNWDRAAYITPLWARINRGLNVKAAEEQIKSPAMRLLAQDDMYFSPNMNLRIIPVEEQLRSKYRIEVYVLLLAAFLTLAIACLNVSSLLLARSFSQRADFSVRLALGESQLMVVSRILFEGVLISVSGALVGFLAANSTLKTLESTIPNGMLPFSEITLSARALILVLVGGVICGIGISTWPAWRILRLSRGNLLEALRRSSTEGRSIKLSRKILVVAQIACAVLAGVLFLSLFRSYRILNSGRLGFDSDAVMVTDLKLPQNQASGKRWKQLATLLVNNLAAQEGIVSAAVAIAPPVTLSLRTSYKISDNNPQKTSGIAEYRAVGPKYFSVLGIPLRKGRSFSDIDNSKSRPVCLLNETLARKHFVEGQEVGNRITPIGMGPCEVIGVVGDVASHNLKDRPAPAIYVPFDQLADAVIQGSMSILVRTRAGASYDNPDYYRNLLVQTVRRDAPTLPANIRPLATIVGELSSPERFRAMLMGVVSLIAIILATCGVYGVVANYVVQRRHDMIIRLSLGATTGRVIRGILKDTLILAALGLMLGLFGAYPLLKVLRGVLFGVSGIEIFAIVVCALVILLAVFISAYLPARRIMRLNMADILRDI
jgi:putative ABC transport system permease protein